MYLMLMTAADTTTDRVSLFSRQHRLTTLAVIALVTLGAYENRATTTVLPAAATELHAMQWFGLITSASAITYLIATTAAGVFTDQRGPRTVMVWALSLFVIAQLGTALAPSTPWLTTARALSGIAEGGLDIALTVLVTDVMPERLRARIFAMYSIAWILPSLVGPGLAGFIADHLGWRASFILPLVLIIPATAALLPALRKAQPRPARAWTSAERRRVQSSAVLAACIGVLTWAAAAAGGGDKIALIAVAATAVGLAWSVRRVLPAGTVRLLPGLPAITGVTLLQNGAFQAIGAFLPLLLASVLHLPATLVGISLTVTGVFWALGSNIVSRDAVLRRFDAGQLTRTGLALIALGGVGPILLALDLLPLIPAMAIFAIAAVGMGVAGNVLATSTVASSDLTDRGEAMSARGLSSAVGVTLATALGGSLVATQADHLTGTPIAITIGVGIATAIVGAATARRAMPEAR